MATASGAAGIDPRDLARVRTQVWFAEMALQALKAEAPAEAATEAELVLGPIVRLLALAEIKLSEVIDAGTVRRVEPPGAP
jgi:hypothetical protein